MEKSTLTSKGQTTVPRGIRKRLQIGSGDVLVWEAEEGVIKVSVGGPAFLRRKGSVSVGPGSVVEDVRLARRRRGGPLP